MKNILFTLLAGLMLLASQAFAQDRTVTGQVTAENGSVLPGVNVSIQGTTRGTTTTSEGTYSIAVANTEVLVFSFIGFETEERVVGTESVINVMMTNDVNQLQEVVVTALGISREKKALGYAVQEIKGEEVSTVKQQNFVNSLSGKIAGIQIRQNNTFGGSTNVLIRGNNSLAGNNQPLFVVDGVPISNYQGNSLNQANGRRGYDYGNAASDINAEDIETISILKSAAATALYGSRGSNGVVLITTKKGTRRKGIGVSINSGVNFGRIDKSTFLKYQKEYGAGYSPWYGPTNPYFEDADINGDGVVDLVNPTREDGSYGAKFDPNLMVYQWESFVPESENFGNPMPWVAAENDPSTFFEQQVTFNSSVDLSGGNEKGAFRLGYTNFSDKGILPNSTQNRNTLNFSGSFDLGTKLKAGITGNYTNQATVGRFSTGYGDNLMSNFRQWWQTNVDVKRQKYFYDLTGRNVTWNMNDPINGDTGPIYWDNPYWTRYENYNSDNRGRLFGNMNLTYQVTNWFSVLGRVSMDTYSEVREERRAVGSIATEFGLQNNEEKSGYQRTDIDFTEMNYDIIGNFNRSIGDDFSINGIAGINIRRESRETIIQSTSGGLAIPGLYAISNSINTTPFPTEDLLEKQVNGYYASASLGYKDTYFLELTDRIDVSSALPRNNNTYNYYSASGSYVFSNHLNTSWLRFGKVRFGYAEVGNDAPALSVGDVYNRIDNFGSTVLTSVPITKNNPDLRPERTKSWEAGLEMNTLEGRLGLDLTVYNVNTVDQILRVTQSLATGYGFRYVNAGNLTNKGIEISLFATPVQANGFEWRTVVNFARNINRVGELYQGVENIVLATYQGGVTVNATKGERYGTLRGTGFQYLNGQRVVNTQGFYLSNPDQVIGIAQPDWTGGITNSFSYKGFNLSFLIDASKGGDVYSLDMHYGQGTGLPDYTAGLNDLGNEVRAPVADGGGLLNEGVLADGTPNTTRARANDYSGYFYWGNAARNPAALTTYDASFVKLREASLSYRVPGSILKNFGQNLTLSVVGRNLWIIHKNVPFADPESGLGSGNAQGYLVGSYPTVRNLGFRVQLDF
ncbi:SusC/RagA family TonB-linked outer membrane protein [Telluribacter sp.]|jgi:TonB-linked SusC/RagA family outer membrane protein|uniref:SusC/RagA family TonB-linked outer membrane protein n=1 Tax=Telluribacter sp. TaxID=1978767 RepID=UPI002E0EBC6F|nr:SusC/RagA family TonB-linked outer membrane protein [Telluribacter sp.]